MADEPFGGNEDEQDGTSIEERARNGEEPEVLEEPLAFGDGQLSLNLGKVLKNTNARKVRGATLVLQGGKKPISGLLDPDQEYDLIVRVLPDMPAPKALRHAETRKVEATDLAQTAQVQSIKKADADAIRDIFSNLLVQDEKKAAALLDELREFVSEGLRQAA